MKFTSEKKLEKDDESNFNFDITMSSEKHEIRFCDACKRCFGKLIEVHEITGTHEKQTK